MTAEELQILVSRILVERCEKQNLELKAAHGGTPKRLYDTLSSFSNQDGGGVIVFGIDESTHSVVGVYDPQDLHCKNIATILDKAMTDIE